MANFSFVAHSFERQESSDSGKFYHSYVVYTMYIENYNDFNSALGSEGRSSVSSPISLMPPLSPQNPLITKHLSSEEMFSG